MRYSLNPILAAESIASKMTKKYIDRQIKVKVTLEQVMNVQRGSRGIAPFFL
jgi:hypothetical protein